MAASWAFTGRTAVSDIMGFCHWKSHTTFTSFSLKDLAWSNGEVLTLDRFVALQSKIHTDHPQ